MAFPVKSSTLNVFREAFNMQTCSQGDQRMLLKTSLLLLSSQCSGSISGY